MTIEQLIGSSAYPQKSILEKLICNRLCIAKEDLFTDIERTIDKEDLSWIQAGYLSYTVDKKPLAYILGYVEFTDIRFEVTPKTLIPRPETEYMIQAINEYVISNKQTDVSPVKGSAEGEGFLAKKQFAILDIGTGCGVLGLSVHYHNQSHISQVLLSELDADTLDVAKRNAAKLFPDSPSIDFVQSNLLHSPVVKDFLTHTPTILVANLPYIPEELFDNNTDEGIKKWEPKMAFVGGDDGCDLYREMFDQLLELGSRPIMFLEMMTWQVDVLRKEYPQFVYEEVKTFHFNIRILKVIVR